MYTYIYKKTTNINASKQLQIKDQNIAFFIRPLLESSTFLSTDDGKKWHLKFFQNSAFPQELIVEVYNEPIDGQRHTGKVIGKSCWQNNSGSSEKNNELIENVSMFLRNSLTLNLSQGKELTSDRMLLADRDGFAYLSADPDQFKRIVLCQALAIAYQQMLYSCMAELTKLIKSGSTDQTLDLYEKTLRFNAADYFSLPVLLERHELFAAWQVLSDHYKLKLLSQELTQQLSDVAILLHTQREQERAARERDKEKQEQTRREQESKKLEAQKKADEEKRYLEDKKDKDKSFRITALGVILAAAAVPQFTPKQIGEAYDSWKSLFQSKKSDQPEAKNGSNQTAELQATKQLTRKHQ